MSSSTSIETRERLADFAISSAERAVSLALDTESYSFCVEETGRDDFDEPAGLSRIAETAGMSADDFRKEFEYLTDGELPPIVFRVDA